MNDRTTEAGPIPPSLPADRAGSGLALTPPATPLPAGHAGRCSRRAALEAGRMFHRTRVWACDLALADPDHHRWLIKGLLSDLAPALVGFVGEMIPSAAGEVERRFWPWLQNLIGRLGGAACIERLQQEQKVLDALTAEEQATCDLDAHRMRFLSEIHDEIDDGRDALLAVVPEGAERAFRLGELLEMGAFPLSPVPPEPWLCPDSALPSFAAGPPIMFGAPPQNLQLVLPRLPAVAYERPWPSWWPSQVRVLWVTCGLNAEDTALPETGCLPFEADGRERIVKALAVRAANYFEVLDRPPVALEDRLRIVDEGAQEVSLDGDRIVIEHRAAFLILCDLLRAPGHQRMPKELNGLPGCKGDISKILDYLPERLRPIVRSRRGPNAPYFLQLPPRQTVAI